MMYQISKEFHLSASHQLFGLAEGHPCGRIHGHNYIIRVALQAQKINDHGFLVDYNDLKPFGKWLDETMDHQHLNEVFEFQPSAENMARHLTQELAERLDLPEGCTVSVSISETPKTWATWSQ